MAGDVEKTIAVGLVWGATNALMRRGALIWDQALLLIWQYSIPFLLNISASATFFSILSHTPISLAVPVTNATTFTATTFVGMLLGEKTRLGFTLLGTDFIVLGIWLCIST